jgi:hypothetical protein
MMERAIQVDEVINGDFRSLPEDTMSQSQTNTQESEPQRNELSAPALPTAKDQYQPPELIEHGKLEDLTEFGSIPSTDGELFSS